MRQQEKMTGYVHSLQTMGAVDGPGIRYCVFLQGCPLRCMYCHNPDTWLVKKSDKNIGTLYSAEELVRKILRYKPYFSNEGGVTVSGGEPLLQAEFVTELFSRLHEYGINTCLDTSGNFPEAISEWNAEKNNNNGSQDVSVSVGSCKESLIQVKYRKLLEVTDLVICDIKFTTEHEYQEYCGGSLLKVQEFLAMVTEHSVPLWIRHVIVPGYTDSEEEVTGMVQMARSYPTLKKIELLPFHKLCIPKYEALGIPFRCADIPECSGETIKRLERLLDSGSQDG